MGVTPYSRSKSFTDHSSSYPTTPQPGVDMDIEYNAIKITMSSIITELAKIQRADGELANNSVHLQALNSSIRALLALDGANITGESWVTAEAYSVKDVIENDGGVYLCAIGHTSDDFTTDLSNGYWITIYNPDTGSIDASNVGFDSGGGIVSTDVQAAITEVFSILSDADDTKQGLDGNLTALADLTGAADKLPYFTGLDELDLASFTSLGRTIAAAASASAVRTALGLGSSAVIDVGTSANKIVQLDSNARLPAVSGRNLPDSRGFVLLTEQECAAAAGTINEYVFSALAAYDNYYFEGLSIGCDTDSEDLLMELYVDGNLIGVGGTTGKMNSHLVWDTKLNEGSVYNTGDDYFQVSETDYLGLVANESVFHLGIKFRNPGNGDFAGSGDVREYPNWKFTRADGEYRATNNMFSFRSGAGHCKVPGVLTGFKIRWATATSYFDGGIIRIYGYDGPMEL